MEYTQNPYNCKFDYRFNSSSFLYILINFLKQLDNLFT